MGAQTQQTLMPEAMPRVLGRGLIVNASLGKLSCLVDQISLRTSDFPPAKHVYVKRCSLPLMWKCLWEQPPQSHHLNPKP